MQERNAEREQEGAKTKTETAFQGAQDRWPVERAAAFVRGGGRAARSLAPAAARPRDTPCDAPPHLPPSGRAHTCGGLRMRVCPRPAKLIAAALVVPPAAPPLRQAGRGGPRPPRGAGRRRSEGAILRCCGRRFGRLWREGGGSGAGSDSSNGNNNSGSDRGCSCCSGLASPFAQPRGQDPADMSDVEENNFEGRVSGRPSPGRAQRG